MSDLDDELLAMAGDDDSDSGSEAGDAGDRTQAMSDDPRSPRSPSQEAKPSVEKVEEEAPSRPRGVAQKVKKRGRKKVSKRELEDELLDLGDDSASEPESLRAGAIGGSDDEADASGEEEEAEDDGPLYPIEGKFSSEQERRDIMNMPEIQREEILAERAAEALKRQQDLQLKKALANAKATANKHKRKAAQAELEDVGAKRGAKKTSALDNYKAAREAKGTSRTGRFDRTADRKDERSPSSASERDADGESEIEWADTTAKSEPAADLKDFERCRVGRSNFAKVCFYPNFEETISGCFTRVSIGVNRETGMNMYRMAQIKGFKEGKPYEMEDSRGKHFKTDQYAIVAQGNSEKPWPFHACSDGKFTLDEFQRYHRTMEEQHLRVPKKSWLEKKLQDIHSFLNITWNDTHLAYKFNKMSAMQKKLDPANIAKAKREAVEQRRAKAENDGDEEELAKCEAELTALDENAATNGNTVKPKLSPMKQATKTEADKLAALNARNRGKTSADVRTALLAERRKIHMERERAFKEAKAAKEREAALLAVPTKNEDDLFGDTPDISRAGTPISGVGTPRAKGSRAGTPVNGGIKKERSGIGRRKMEEEVVDLGIEVDI